MSHNKFVGIAYWSVDAKSVDWPLRAMELLMALQTAGLAKVVYEATAVGDQLTVSFDGEAHKLLVNRGSGRGVVRPTKSSSLFVVCLVALRRALGDIKVVNDSQEDIPPKPRQTDPLFSTDWARVRQIAQALGLIVSDSFADKYPTFFRKTF